MFAAIHRPKGKNALLAAAIAKEGIQKTITLVPYGCTKFRVSMFPASKRTIEAAAEAEEAEKGEMKER